VTQPGSRPDSGFALVGERLIYDGHVITVYEAEFTTPDGDTMRRDVVRHPGAVGVVAVDGDEVVLVRQFRAPVATDILEIPAGRRDVAGEPPELTASRELAEEVGFEAGHLESLGGFHNSVGFCDEYVHLFLATDLTPVDFAPDGPEEEHMQIVRIPLGEVAAVLDEGTITDSKTIIGLRAALARLGR
jgi:ADP-ribose pyrophosphatase